MSGLKSNLRRELESNFSETAINNIEAGILAIFVTKPECMFFRFDDGEYERADVYFSTSAAMSQDPENLADTEFTTRVHSTTADDVLAHIREQEEIYVTEVAVGFGTETS